MVPTGVLPLLVFVNVKSGGCQGSELISSFRKLLNPYQVFDLDNGGPLPGYLKNRLTVLEIIIYVLGCMFFVKLKSIKYWYVEEMEQLVGSYNVWIMLARIPFVQAHRVPLYL